MTLQIKLQEAITLHQKGEFAQAKVICEELLAAQENDADALHLLGMIEYHTNNPKQAIRLFNTAIKNKPDNAIFYFSCANALYALQQPKAAIGYYNQAINIKPDYIEAYTNRGLALQALMKLQAAIESYNCAIAINPDVAEIYVNRGLALQKLNQFSTAIANYDHAIVLNPDFAESYFNGGNAWQALSDFEKAIHYYDNAIRIKSDYADAYFNRALALQKSNRFEQALESYRQAMNASPAYAHLLGTLSYLNMKLCNWIDLDKNLAELINCIERGEKSSSGFPLVALTNSLAIQRKVSELWTNDNYPADYSLGSIPKRAKPHKIKIGYFSADFYHHPISILMAEVFELHDKNRFEIIAFSLGHHQKDTMQLRIERAVDQFIDVRYETDEAVAMLARQLNIDVAVDLGGATSNARTGIFSYRAAPVQVNYLGYPGTMGAPYFDYLIADKTIIPEPSQRYYVEKIAYLPDSYQANDTTRKISEREFTRLELGLPEKGFIFCCLNNNYKITPAIFDSWMRILKTVAGSVLFLFADNECAKENLRKEAQSRGVDSNRLVFAEGLPIADYLARYKVADLFLNTFPYNAGTTASDALWAGLPVLTWSGGTFVSRVTASLLRAIDLPELITESQEAYEALAIELATDPNKLNAIKAKLAKNIFTTPLFNTPLFARHIEKAYTHMVERYYVELAPDHIYVESQGSRS